MKQRFGFWFLTLLMLAVVALFVRLAVWQYHRGEVHAAQLAALASTERERARPIPASGVVGLPRYARVTAVGRYEAGRQIILIERPQPHGPAIGAYVVTPLHLVDGRILLVNRGWIEANPRGRTQNDLAPPVGTVQVGGYLADMASADVHLGGGRNTPGQWPKYLLYPRWKYLETLYGAQLVHRVLWLQAGEPGGYDRNWRFAPAHSPMENYGYMVQWIGLAVTVFIVWLVLTLRMRRRSHGDERQ